MNYTQSAAFLEQFMEPFEGTPIIEQIDAVQAISDDPESDFLVSGGAGTGKSYFTRILRSILPVSVCSTTAMSAIGIGGITVDKMFGFSRDTWKIRNPNTTRQVMAETAPTILIDEASMIGYNMAGPIYDIARRYCKRLILVGDLAQACPVKDDWGIKHMLFREAKRITLTHCHRQNDAEYLAALNQIRMGIVTPEIKALFSKCIDNGTCPDDYVRLFASNKMADDYNSMRFSKLPQTTPFVKLMGEYTDLRSNQEYPVSEKDIDKAFESSRIANGEPMQIGARVLLGVNDQSMRFVNGDTGVVTDIHMFDGGTFSSRNDHQIRSIQVVAVEVRLDRTNQTVMISRVERLMKDHKKKQAARIFGFPIKLGWAHSIHKSQGMTLAHAYLSLSSIASVFKDEGKHGIAYVGLSRTTSLSGLRIDSWVDEAIYCNPAVKDFI
jgi:ATP-dependent DNA helicase PIF1